MTGKASIKITSTSKTVHISAFITSIRFFYISRKASITFSLFWSCCITVWTALYTWWTDISCRNKIITSRAYITFSWSASSTGITISNCAFTTSLAIAKISFRTSIAKVRCSMTDIAVRSYTRCTCICSIAIKCRFANIA